MNTKSVFKVKHLWPLLMRSRGRELHLAPPFLVEDYVSNAVQGTIHILRKHLYSIKLNLITKLGFFVKTKEFVFQHYDLTKITLLVKSRLPPFMM